MNKKKKSPELILLETGNKLKLSLSELHKGLHKAAWKAGREAFDFLFFCESVILTFTSYKNTLRTNTHVKTHTHTVICAHTLAALEVILTFSH